MRVVPFFAAFALLVSMASFAKDDAPKPRPYTLVLEGSV